jgi:hypothetical protein
MTGTVTLPHVSGALAGGEDVCAYAAQGAEITAKGETDSSGSGLSSGGVKWV